MFRTVFVLLIRLRWKIAARAALRSSSVLVGVGLTFLLALPAAFAGGNLCRAQFATLATGQAEGMLSLVLLAFQVVWLLLFVLPEGLASLSRSVPIIVLRPFPARPLAILFAATLASLLDLPLLFAVPVLGAVIHRFGVGGFFAGAVALTTVVLLCVQTAALSQLLEQAGALLSRPRRASVSLTACAALGLGIYFGLPNAFASTLERDAPRTLVHLRHQPAAPPPVAAAGPRTLLPSGLAAYALVSAAQGQDSAALLSLVGLAAMSLLTFGVAVRLLKSVLQRDSGSSGSRMTSRRRRSRAPSTEAGGCDRAGITAMAQVAAIHAVEFRNLTRNPRAHLPLRSPATLLLTLFIAWILPNGDPNALGNLWDMMGMGGILYVLLWQVQLLCDRFGNDAGTATRLFGFSAPRWRLIVGRNTALGALLAIVDSTVIAGFCGGSARAPHLILPILAWLPAVLVIATALGNIVTVLAPFPIPKQGETFRREPERGVAFVYVLVGIGTSLLLWPALAMLNAARLSGSAVTTGAIAGATLYVLLLYGGSVAVAARVLARHEPFLARILDGKE